MKKKWGRPQVMMTVIATCLFAQSVWSQSKPLGIKQAIDIALANNYGLQSDSLNLQITAYKNKDVAGNYLPQANLKSSMEYNAALPKQMLPGELVGQPAKEYVPVTFGTKYKMGSGIEVTQNIYRKDLLIKMKAAGLNNEVARTKYRLSKEELIYEVANSFYALQTNAEKIRTTASDYNNMKEILVIAKAQYDQGTMKRIDYETLEINVANQLSQLKQLQTQYDEQLEYFKYQLAIPVSANISIEQNIAPISTVAHSDNIWERADLHLSKQMIDLKESEIKSIRAERAPVISTYFKFNYESQFGDINKAFNQDYWYKSAMFGLSTSISIFDGNRRRSRVGVAQSELQQLKLQHIQQQQYAQTELATAWHTLDNNREQYQITQRNLALAEKVFTSRKALYTEGVTTLIELLDAERDLTKARDLYTQALINVQTGMLNVYKANGTLVTEFLKSI
ncbi:MAG: TolC family protein [Bacteroidetes bacterium]|nr:TolC family protein [Bacteroidota bacterium]